MSRRPSPQIASRKQPRQARAVGLVSAILEAATHVLAEDGEEAFTTARVAERAGVSIGSLYQYFPNKAAILYRLQSDEWRETSGLLRRTLEDRTRPPYDRLREALRAFIRSECDEARMRTALEHNAPDHHDGPEGETTSILDAFLEEVLPGKDRALAVTLVVTTIGELGRTFSEQPRTADEIRAWADAMTEMFWGYFQRLSP